MAPSHNYHLRNYNPCDFESLEKVLIYSQVHNPKTDTRKAINRKIEYDPNSIIVGTNGDDKNILGTVFFVYDPWKSTIFHLGVHPDHQNNGLGKMLLKEAEKRLKERGTRRVQLHVREGNEKVLGFYDRRGYHVEGSIYNLGKKAKKIKISK